MAAKKQQTHAKRARELAVKEKRERKRARRAGVAAPVPVADKSSLRHYHTRSWRRRAIMNT